MNSNRQTQPLIAMPPLTIPAKAKGKGKGKEPVGTSQQLPDIPPNALDLLHPAITTEFEDSFKTRLVMKPHIFDKHDAIHAMGGFSQQLFTKDDKYNLLEERMLAMEGQKTPSLDFESLGLVSDVVIPRKFKFPLSLSMMVRLVLRCI